MICAFLFDVLRVLLSTLHTLRPKMWLSEVPSHPPKQQQQQQQQQQQHTHTHTHTHMLMKST